VSLAQTDVGEKREREREGEGEGEGREWKRWGGEW
jgi:hypothetical protein